MSLQKEGRREKGEGRREGKGREERMYWERSILMTETFRRQAIFVVTWLRNP